MKILIHIGTAKTGTTSIQRFLHENRSELATQNVVLLDSFGANNQDVVRYSLKVSPSDTDGILKKRGIPDGITKKEFDEEVERRLRGELSRYDSDNTLLIITSEHFFHALKSEDELLRLKTLLNDYTDDIVILCYFRAQVDYVHSDYSTFLKVGGVSDFNTFVDGAKSASKFDYDTSLLVWGNIFGADNLRVRMYSTGQFEGGDVIEDFSSLCGIKTQSCIKPGRKNVSLSAKGQLILIELNIALSRLGAKRSNLQIISNHRKLTEVLSYLFVGVGFQMCPAEALEYQENFKNFNAQFYQNHTANKGFQVDYPKYQGNRSVLSPPERAQLQGLFEYLLIAESTKEKCKAVLSEKLAGKDADNMDLLWSLGSDNC